MQAVTDRTSALPADLRTRARLFAAEPHAPRSRRPTDVLLLAATGITFGWMAVRADDTPAGLEAALVDLLANLPEVLLPVWQMAHDLLFVLAVLVVVLAAVRRHGALVRDLVVAAVGTVAAAAVGGRLAVGAWPDALGSVVHRNPPVAFPYVALATAVAVVSVASPHLARPYRYLGRAVILLAGIATAALGFALPSQTLGALTLGWAVAAGVHLLFGSPAGLPPLADVAAGLAAVGVDATPFDALAVQGIVQVQARTADGIDLDIKVHGRDAWDGQLLVSLWHFLWYRDRGTTVTLSRVQQVEHEAFLTLLAERRGAPVAPVVAAGIGRFGDALLVTRRLGLGLAAAADELTDGDLDRAWDALERLHAAALSHGALDPEHVRADAGTIYLSDLSSAELSPSPADLLIDRAQLLTTTAIVCGIPRAVEAGLRAMGTDGLTAVASYLQPAALTPVLRREAAAADLDVDDLRKAAVEAVGAQVPPLQRLRRLSWGRVLMGVLLFVAASALIGSLTDIGISNIVDAMAAASLPLLLVAFVVGQTPRVANAAALTGASPVRVPFGRLVALQFAQCFVALAMPSTAGRVAVNIRFFQRNGVGSTEAVTIGAVDGFTGFIGQMLLLLTYLLFGLGTLDLNAGALSLAGAAPLLLWLALAVVVVVAVVLLVPKLRRLVFSTVRRVWGLVGPLARSPRRLAVMIGANLASELLFSLCAYITLLAFGQSVAFADVVVVIVGVSLFAGLMPVPGGIGVSEAALTAGFIAIGVDDATAFAAAITYRMLTFYVPPVLGVVAFRWLQRQRFL